jgi:hemerythrin
MKEKIVAFLKTKLQAEIVKYGVPENFLLGVADTWSKTIKDEKDIEATLTDGIIETLKLSASHLQSEGDKRVNQAKLDLKTWLKDHGLNEDGTPIKKDEPPKKSKSEPDPNEPSWFKEYREKKDAEYAELKTKLEKQEQEKELSALVDKVKTHEKIKNIPASFLRGRNLTPKSEGEIDQLVASIETDYNGFKQEMAEQGVVISVPPSGGGTPKEGETIGKAIAERKNTNASDGVKGKTI